MSQVRKGLFYIILTSIVAFIIGASYKRGLFFDRDFYWLELLFSLLFIIYLLVDWKKSLELFAQPHVWMASIIPFLYLITAFFAENQQLAYDQFLRWMMASQLFILVFMMRKDWLKELFFFSIVLTGIWTAVFGWLAAYQMVDFRDAFLSYRISSVFQYPNTFAAILAAILIGLLIRSADRNWKYSFLSFFSFLLFITIIFTYSRGAWLVFAVIWFLTLFLLSLRQQIYYLIQMLLIGGMSLILLSPLTESIKNQSYQEGLKWILMSSVTVGIIYVITVYMGQKLIKSENRKMIYRLILPLVMIVSMAVGLTSLYNESILEKLPESLKIRIESINLESQSAESRFLFVQDAAKMIKDHPFFGEGGGAWKQQYERYQSYPYTSRQAHNFYYQMAIETGLIGLGVFLIFLFLILLSLLRHRKELIESEYNRVAAFGAMLVLLLVHSYIDFNMSYLYYLALIMILLGMTAHSLEFKIPKIKIFKFSVLSVMLILSMISVLFAGRFDAADRLIKSIVQVPINEAIQITEKAIAKNPYQVEYRFNKINFYQQRLEAANNKQDQNEIIKEIQEIEEMNLVNSDVVLKLAQSYGSLGYLGNSLQVIDKGIENGPWRIQLYDQKVIYAFNLARHYKENGEADKYGEMINEIRKSYEEILKRREYLDQQIPALKYGIFQPSETMRLIVGQTDIVEEQMEEGLKLLIPLTNSLDENIKNQAIAWSVYGYQKLNNKEKADEFLKMADPNKIEELIKGIYQTWN